MGGKSGELSGKQKLFCMEYLKDMNATQAAIRAGYSPKSAQMQSSRLLSNAMVSREIEANMRNKLNKIEISVERVLTEIARLAFFDPRKLFDADGKPVHVSQLDDDTAAAVAGLDIVTQGNQEIGFAEVLKVKLADKSRNLELLGKYLKMFVERIEHSGDVQVIDRILEARKRARQTD